MDLLTAKGNLVREIEQAGYQITYVKTLRGRVSHGTKICILPQSVTRKSVYYTAHELYHALEPRKSRHANVCEMKAEKFAQKKLREMGVPVPRSSVVRGKRYVAMKVRRAIKRGVKELNEEVLNYISDYYVVDRLDGQYHIVKVG